MAPNKRNKAQIISDRLEIAQRYLQGQFQHEIADALNLTQEMVSYDLKAIYQHWQESYAHQLEKLRAQELARIGNLERTYWEAWEQSQQPRDITSTSKEGEKVKQAKRSEHHTGNPAFLSGVRWCIERRCKLLGLDAPLQADTNIHLGVTTDFDPSKLTTEELMQILRSGDYDGSNSD